jgi:ParB-like chromosome segregation protein Spo0J
MEIESIAVEELHLDPANVRRHDAKNLDAIAASLARFGQQKPIVVSPAGVVLAGNGTLSAAKRLGWSSIRAVTTSLEQRRGHRLRHRRQPHRRACRVGRRRPRAAT